MDIASQKYPYELNVPQIISKLLFQQNQEKKNKENKESTFTSKHIKNISLPDANLLNKEEFLKPEYKKVKRSSYDHTKSLRHCDCSFTLNTIFTFNTEKIPIVKNTAKYQTRSIKFRPNFQEFLTRHKNFLKNNKDMPGLAENKRIGFQTAGIKETKRSQRIFVEIPSIRAQTILPSVRGKNSIMVDQDVITDNRDIY